MKLKVIFSAVALVSCFAFAQREEQYSQAIAQFTSIVIQSEAALTEINTRIEAGEDPGSEEIKGRIQALNSGLQAAYNKFWKAMPPYARTWTDFSYNVDEYASVNRRAEIYAKSWRLAPFFGLAAGSSFFGLYLPSAEYFVPHVVASSLVGLIGVGGGFVGSAITFHWGWRILHNLQEAGIFIQKVRGQSNFDRRVIWLNAKREEWGKAVNFKVARPEIKLSDGGYAMQTSDPSRLFIACSSYIGGQPTEHP